MVAIADSLPTDLPVAMGHSSHIDDLVAHVNELCDRGALQTALSVGDYVIANVFDGNAEAIHDRRRKDHSFRKLAQHAALQISGKQLWRMVAVAAQHRHLPEIAHALSMAHQRALLPIKDVQVLRRLAIAAVTRGWTSRDLEREVRIVRGRQQRGGGAARRPHPIVKSAVQLHRATELARAQLASEGLFVSLATYEVEDLLNAMQHDLRHMHEVIEHLQTALHARGALSRQRNDR